MKEERHLTREEETRFGAVVKAAFAHRRKTLVNSLKDEGYDPEPVLAALTSLQVAPAARAEVLSVGQFIELTTRMAAND